MMRFQQGHISHHVTQCGYATVNLAKLFTCALSVRTVIISRWPKPGSRGLSLGE